MRPLWHQHQGPNPVKYNEFPLDFTAEARKPKRTLPRSGNRGTDNEGAVAEPRSVGTLSEFRGKQLTTV